jgi:hypothetical protein
LPYRPSSRRCRPSPELRLWCLKRRMACKPLIINIVQIETVEVGSEVRLTSAGMDHECIGYGAGLGVFLRPEGTRDRVPGKQRASAREIHGEPALNISITQLETLAQAHARAPAVQQTPGERAIQRLTPDQSRMAGVELDGDFLP